MKYLVAVFALAGLSALASAQWTVTILTPVAGGFAIGRGASGSSQVGYACVGPFCRASLWSGTAASWVDLHPPGASQSEALAASGSTQVGYVSFEPNQRPSLASLWSGTAFSRVDLNPAGAIESRAHAVDGSSQVGYARFGESNYRASLWHGNAASWIDLGPGIPWGVHGSTQVGVGNGGHAVLWSGTAASMIDLNPIGATYSLAQGVHGSTQVGYVFVGAYAHASLWSGTAASWVDLHPAGANSSIAWAAYGSNQVGFARFGNPNNETERACIWTGTAASYEDINPAGFTQSRAYAMSSDGIYDYVVGYGGGPSGGGAILWTRLIGTPPPTPTLISGSVTLLDTIGNAGTESIGWTLSNNANTYTGSFTVKDYGTSDYSITVPAEALAGTYTLKFKGGTFLGQTLNVNVAGTPLTTQGVDLPNGDVDQDGEVGPSDFELVVAQFGGTGSADVDNDGEVGPSDFEIVVVMFGSGDE